MPKPAAKRSRLQRAVESYRPSFWDDDAGDDVRLDLGLDFSVPDGVDTTVAAGPRDLDANDSDWGEGEAYEDDDYVHEEEDMEQVRW